MPILNRHIFTIGLLLAAALPAFAQGQRCKLTYYSRAASATMEVYVIDAVDTSTSIAAIPAGLMSRVSRGVCSADSLLCLTARFQMWK